MLIAAAGTVLAPVASAPAAEAVEPALPRVTMDGGDVVTFATPRAVRTSAPLGTAWTKVPVVSAGKLPAVGAGAVIARFRVSAADGTGRLMVRPTGSKVAGATVATFGRTGITDTTFVVKLGADGSVDVAGTAGRPTVSVSVIGFVPETAPLVVPENPPAATSTALGSGMRIVKVAGRAGVPAEATAVLVALETSATHAGVAAAWTSGTTKPTAGYAFPAGSHTTLLTLAPSATGNVAVQALSGAATARLRVLGWALPGSTMTALATPAALGTVAAGGLRAVTVAGRAGVPSAAQDVVLGLSAAAGARIRVWSNTTGTGVPVVDTTSRGGAVTGVLPVPVGRKVSFTVTGTTAATRLAVMGYVSTLGNQKLSFVPKVGTRLLGPGDVVGTGDATVVLTRSAGPARVGDHVLARPPAGVPFVGRVTAVTTGGDGLRTLDLAAAELSDAFDDYDTTYDGALLNSVPSSTLAPPAGGPLAGPAAAPTALTPDKINLQFFKNDWWTCSGSVPIAQLMDVDADYSGDVHFDLDLDQRSLDFSAKGSLTITFTFLGEASVSCTLTAADDHPEIYPRIPLGVSGVAVKFGGKAEFSATTPELTDGGTFSVSAGLNAYTSFYYFDGESDGTATVSPHGDVEANYDGLSLAFRPSLFIAVAPTLPPGVTEHLDADASVSVGAELAVGVPDQMRGPRCLDVTLQPTIETGAKAVAKFFGLEASVSWEGAKWEGPKTTLYQGPCWGWAGTVTYEAIGQTTPLCGPCAYVIRDDRATLTLEPQPARFIAGDIYQPYEWSATTRLTYMGPVLTDWGGLRCWTDVVGTGSGHHGWGGSEAMPTEPFIVRDIAADPDAFLPRRFQASVNDGLVETTTTTGGGEPCGSGSSPGTSYVYIVPDVDPAEHPLPFWASPIANHIWDNGDAEIPEQVAYALTRHEFERP